MRFYQVCSYLFAVILIYLGLFMMDVFVLRHLLDFFVQSKLIDYIFYLLSLLVINPVLTYFIAEKIPYKIHGLLVDEGLSENLKQHKE